MSAELTREQLDELEAAVKGFVGEDWEQGCGDCESQFNVDNGLAIVVDGNHDQVLLDSSDHDCGPEMAAALVAMHNAFPALLQMARDGESLLSENERLRAALHRDKTGLAAALNEVRKIAEGYRWIGDGEWGSYSNEEHTQETLRRETGEALTTISGVALKALVVSGTLTGQALRGEDHLTGARVVLRTIDETADVCPMCLGSRLRVGGEDGVWEEGEIEHRKGCALERETSNG